MPNPYVLPLVAVIGIVVVLFWIGSVIRTLRFVRASQVTVSGDTASAKTLHFNTPRGSMDMQVHPVHDPAIESMPRYPGAQPLDPRFEYEMHVHAPGREGRYVEQGFWTSDDSDVVLAYYQREFPGWQKDRSFMVGEPGGYRCNQQTPGLIRTIEIRWDALALQGAKTFPTARTVIRYSVLKGENLPTLPST